MSGLKEKKLQDIVGRLYEAALDPLLWRDVLHELADALDADSAAIFGLPLNQGMGILHSPGGDEAFAWLAGPGQAVHNPRPERSIRLSSRRPVHTESDLFSDWELKNNPFNAALSKHGIHWEAGGQCASVDSTPVFFTAQRRSGRDRFETADLQAIEALFPHLERAAHIASRLWTARINGILEAFEMISCGVVMIDAAGRILDMNTHAEWLLQKDIQVRDGQFAWKHEPSNSDLGRLLRSLLSDASTLRKDVTPASATLRRPNLGPLVLRGIPIQGAAEDFFRRAKAMLVVTDPLEGRDVSADILSLVYGLTPAEIRLANAIAQGRDLKSASAEHGVTLATTRNQLKAILAKTETRRQAELASLLTRLSLLPR